MEFPQLLEALRIAAHHAGFRQSDLFCRLDREFREQVGSCALVLTMCNCTIQGNSRG